MKLFFISLFLFLSYTLVGQDFVQYKQFNPYTLLNYIENTPIDLTYNIPKLEKADISDFSNLSSSISSYPIYKLDKADSEAIIPFTPINNKWYTEDFSSDPFNGIVDILIMGEPLPSTYVTLFLASILAFTVAKYRKLHNKTGFQEIS